MSSTVDYDSSTEKSFVSVSQNTDLSLVNRDKKYTRSDKPEISTLLLYTYMDVVSYHVKSKYFSTLNGPNSNMIGNSKAS